MIASDKLIEKLDAFVRKYYKNQLIKGVLYTVGLLLLLFILISVFEYFGYFATAVRMVLFWSYLLVSLYFLVRYILLPLSKMYKIGSRISYHQAATIIGKHFPEISDKLLNLLQLKELSSTMGDSDLLETAIIQKTSALSPIPFSKAIDLKQNKKYLKYAAIPLVVLIFLLVAAPSVIKDSSGRIVNYSTYYEKPAPFTYHIVNDSLNALQQEDFLLQISVEGDEIPNEVFIVVDNHEYKMNKLDKTTYSYLFKNVQRTQNFYMQAVDVRSKEYTLNVYPKPVIVDFRAKLLYPSYTGKAAEDVMNIGDLSIPEGTTVEWLFQTRDVDDFYFMVDSVSQKFTPNENGRLTVSKRFLSSVNYGFYSSNDYIPSTDTLNYSISLIPDAMPMIVVMEVKDSLQSGRSFFKGRIKDDYGFSKLQFKISKTSTQDTVNKVFIEKDLPFNAKELTQEFYYSTLFEDIEILPGDIIEYYFEVWDNDGIHGAKSSKSQIFEVKVPTKEELEKILDQSTMEINALSETSLSEIKDMQKDINEMIRKLVDKKELSWQDKKQLEDLAKKQNQIKETLQKMQDQIKQNNQLEQQYKEQTESIIEKQRELDRLYNELLSDEMKAMMDEMNKLMEEMDKKKVQDALENMKLKNENLEKQLDQNIELMKRLELEKKIEDAIKKTEDLAEKQRNLSKETEKASKKETENLLEKQDKLNKEFEQIKKDIDEIQQKLKDIDETSEFKRNKDTEKSISDKQNEASKQLKNNNNKKASEQQKSAADELDKMSEQLAEAQLDMQQEELAEDAEQVRQMLKNLVTLSFEQERLINEVNTIQIQDPKYQEVIASENKIKDDFKTVEDSLRAMAKRQIKVAVVINKELENININVSKSMKGLLTMNQTFYGASKNFGAAASMQYAMMSFNNLALVLAESLDDMQSQMRQNSQKKKSGSCKNSGSCSNPGNNKSGKGKQQSAKSMKDLQDALNKQMEAMKKQLDKQGKQDGRGKIGQGSKMSEEFARMAAQQEQIRRMMQKYGEELKQNSGGKLGKEVDNLLKQMEQTETELVNKTITKQTLMRQQQIMSRLLEHEKAEMQREKEQRRESREAEDVFQHSQGDLDEYNKLKQKELELFREVPPSFTNYYKSKINDYFYKLED
ncbi:MAG: hypothetical protein IKY79_07695 [Bacteroidales bacterium]|nr:hypothetical protein [Bacteroidales bacterium]